MPTPTKITKVEELRKKLDKAVSVAVTDYKGLTVAEITELRKKYRENDVEYMVVKNTLISKAIEGIEFPEMDSALKGPTALAISYEDPIAPVKVTSKFIDDLPKNRKLLTIKAGVLEGRIINEAEIKALADMPSREELITRLVRAFNSPLQGFVNVCAGPLKNFAQVVNAIKEKKENEA
ncbi:MAG: 50S ribosomal protein L10 [Candidatus Muiribacterium halophilum]|uniref:Large ribosomal subunit protein uL10 n=1 Tax=Muiribacterium halophilum TaxID=2053465 RepID=A0A2N5ZGX2_MUIH1|nr:MAG: 50S ribosomal protein L10 [Candidatus Muirbacterium halophilum]